MIPRAATYALLLLLGSALWNWVPPLLFMVTGLKMDEAGMAGPHYPSPWIKVSLAVVLAGFGALLFRGRRTAKNEEFLLAAGFSILFLYLGYNLLSFQDYLFLTKGQADPLGGVVWIFLATGFWFLALLLIAPRRGEWALAATLIFLLVLAPLLASRLPLSGGFSDMFLFMEAGAKSILHGDSPYKLQMYLGEQVQCHYLPGLWLSFLPAVALHLDPRLLEALYSLAFASLIWGAMRPEDRPLGSWFLVLFLLNPWALLRQEVYLSAYLLSWGAFFLALRRDRWSAASYCYGWGLATHPFSWALLPIWISWTARSRGWKEAWKGFRQAVGMAALVILPFVLWDPRGFFDGAVFHWVNNVAVADFGLAAWLVPWRGFLTALALVFLGSGAWAAWKGTGSLDSLFRWMALSLFLALLSSYHVQHYYYFVPLALLLLHEVVVLEGGGKGERVK